MAFSKPAKSSSTALMNAAIQNGNTWEYPKYYARYRDKVKVSRSGRTASLRFESATYSAVM